MIIIIVSPFLLVIDPFPPPPQKIQFVSSLVNFSVDMQYTK